MVYQLSDTETFARKTHRDSLSVHCVHVVGATAHS